MARSLKSLGLRDLNSVRSRAIRQLTLGRVWKSDVDKLLDLLNQAEALIVSMDEKEEGTLHGD